MEYTKSQVQILIRGGDGSTRLRATKRGNGLYYIIVRGSLQQRLQYCSLCDKVLTTGLRGSNNTARHVRSMQHIHNRVRQSVQRRCVVIDPNESGGEDNNEVDDGRVEKPEQVSTNNDSDSEICSDEA